MTRIASVLTLLALVMIPALAARRASNTARHDTKAHEQEQDSEQLMEKQSLPVEVFHAMKNHFKRLPPLPRPAGRILPSHVRPYMRPQTEPQPPRTPMPSMPSPLQGYTPEVLARKEPGLKPVPEVPPNTRPYEVPPNSPPYVHAVQEPKPGLEVPPNTPYSPPYVYVAEGGLKQEPVPPNTPYSPPYVYAVQEPKPKPGPPSKPFSPPYVHAVADANLKQEPKPKPEVPPNKPYSPPSDIQYSPPYVHAVADGNQKQEPQSPYTPYIVQPEYPPPQAPNAEKPTPERFPPWAQYHQAAGHVARPTWIDTVWPKPKPEVPPNTIYAEQSPMDSPLLAVGDGGLKQEPNTPYPPPFTYPPSAALAFADGNPKQEANTPYPPPFTYAPSAGPAFADGNVKQQPQSLSNAKRIPRPTWIDTVWPNPKQEPQPPDTPYIVVPPYPPNAALNGEKPKPAANPEKPSWTPPWWWHDPHRPPSQRPYPKSDKQDKSTAGAALAGAALFAAQGSTPAPEEAHADQPQYMQDGSQLPVIASPGEAWRPWNWIGGLLGPTQHDLVRYEFPTPPQAGHEVSISGDQTEDSHAEDDSAEDIFHRIDETEDWNPAMSQDDSDDSSAPAPSDSSADEQQEPESEEDLSDIFYRNDETMDW